LRLLHDEHTKKAQELDRKVARLIQDGKDPNLPQPLPSIATPSSPLASESDSGLRDAVGPIEESFMLLGQKNELNSSFAQFWKILEGMLDHLSQPVAFATAPLHSPKNEKPTPTSNTQDGTSGHRQFFEYPPAPSSSKFGTFASPISHDPVDDNSADMDDSWEVDSDGRRFFYLCYLLQPYRAESFQMVGADTKPTDSPAITKAPSKGDSNELGEKLQQAQLRIIELEKHLKERMIHEHQLRDSIMQVSMVLDV
jgi:hypothetical protein